MQNIHTLPQLRREVNVIIDKIKAYFSGANIVSRKKNRGSIIIGIWLSFFICCYLMNYLICKQPFKLPAFVNDNNLTIMWVSGFWFIFLWINFSGLKSMFSVLHGEFKFNTIRDRIIVLFKLPYIIFAIPFVILAGMMGIYGLKGPSEEKIGPIKRVLLHFAAIVLSVFLWAVIPHVIKDLLK